MFCIPPHLQEEVHRPRYDHQFLAFSISDDQPLLKARTLVQIDNPVYLGGVEITEPSQWGKGDLEKQSYDLPRRSPKNKKGRIPILFRIGLILSFFILHLILHPFSLSLPFSKHISVPPLDPSFISHCHSLLSPPDGLYATRLDKLSSILQNGVAWISEPSPSTSYFTAFSPSSWHLSERPFLIAIHNSSITILTPSFETLRASLVVNDLPLEVREKVEWVEWREDESPYSVLSSYLAQRGVGGFMLDDGVRQFVGRGLKRDMKAENKGGLEDEIRGLRERKEGWEVGLMRCANQFTLHAIRKTRQRMYIGISESQTSKILEEEMGRTGMVGGEGLVLFGENAALPHGSGTDRKLTKKDLVLIDAGGKWGGYVSDITRTFALPSSTIPKSHIKLWETVRQAQIAPYELLNSSNGTLTFGDLDKSARAVVSNWKNGDSLSLSTSKDSIDYSIFTHRLGHGIGLEGHESPYVIQGPQGEREIEVGNVFSLEPGIYLPSNGHEVNGLKGIGVRLEDCVVLTRGDDGTWGGEWLSGPVEGWGDI
ncbi:hypothetical protein I302_107423 [Kwoniella bestiolae CBS 10118]|uniref:Peptidase M24 domain-containing protein n=1 Tax=Kwoniella bestiolae CBS 10118 TaxID=1296100 RepID=A0A1B9FYK2_9TREE|nr:hypothetical protein I302_06836 [Kwoniella bestiolae CBS 10118]OCF23852.1 hypothetical protein I302_06836 [Kwoniella bestiolae CBS 10118]